MKTHTIIGGGGLRLQVDEAGNPHGKSVLFIHGFSQCRLAWSKQLASELANEFRLVAMDLRGHGLSEKPRDVYEDSRLWADDVQAVITTLGLEHPVLCGWSYGGVVICDYLRFHGEEQIAGINLVGALTGRPGQEMARALGSDMQVLGSGLISTEAEESVGALQAFVRLCVYKEHSPSDFYFFLGFNAAAPSYVRAGLGSHLGTDHTDLLPRIRKPVLITHGREDAVVLLSVAEGHAAAIPHAHISLYPEIGHAPFWEDVGRFNRELGEFVRSL